MKKDTFVVRRIVTFCLCLLIGVVAGVPALARQPLSENGWLVRRVFVEADEGNRLRRAVAGFGSGQADFRAVVSLSDLSRGTPGPFYEMNTGGESRRLPGAMITLNPFAAAARFVLAGRDLDRSVERTASNIASSVARNIS